MKTIRQDMLELLKEGPISARELSQSLHISEREVYDHLGHLSKSVSGKGMKLRIEPARCLSCNYVFRERSKMSPPGRCPKCRNSHLAPPSYLIT
ncbi:MAG: HTH domain-containing protein [Desulfobulbaceae bacterium]|nr:HTH domain-containing protein [Desulfobulbaceae bacterium]